MTEDFIKKFNDSFLLLRNLPSEKKQQLFENAMQMKFGDGDIILDEGTACSGIGIVADGTVRVFKMSEEGKEITLYRIYAGEICVMSLTCMMGGINYPVIAQAEGEVEVLNIPADYFRSMIGCNEVWQKYIFSQLAYRMFDLMSVLEEVAFFSMDRRLADLLLEKSNEKSVIELTHEAIAFELGSAREVISRLLKDFERRGLVALSRGRITITDLKKLRHMV